MGGQSEFHRRLRAAANLVIGELSGFTSTPDAAPQLHGVAWGSVCGVWGSVYGFLWGRASRVTVMPNRESPQTRTTTPCP